MSQSAFISLVVPKPGQTLTLDMVKEQLKHYREQTSLTGKQLAWDYADAAFPYTIETRPGEEDKWFYLKGTNPLYKYIIFGIGERQEGDTTIPYIQVVLPDGATHGDKAKANEICKWLGRRLQAEVKLFNGRIMRFQPLK